MSNNTYLSPICSCIICRQTKSAKGIHSHYITAHTDEGNKRVKSSSIHAAERAAILAQYKFYERQDRYNKLPNLCQCCNTALSYEQRNNTYCSHSCSSIISNTIRKNNGYVVSIETKDKIRDKLNTKPKRNKLSKDKTYTCAKCKTIYSKKVDKINCCNDQGNSTLSSIQKLVYLETKQTTYDFTPIKKCKCKHCKEIFYRETQIQYCADCKNHHSNLRSIYRFKFNIFEYPSLFDLELLSNVGFYAPGGKAGRWNINGLSRDHKVSVAEAIKYNYDPYYITHPCNCELMPHKENDKKKSKSSIRYEDLIEAVIKYDMVEITGIEPVVP